MIWMSWMFGIGVLNTATHPFLCCKTEIDNSAANAPAIWDIPGLVTVHCWSKVLPLRDWNFQKKINNS